MIPSQTAHLNVAARSHPGMTGKNNEDRYGVSAYWLSENDPTPCVLALVADGIGGNRAGEVASELAIETISRYIAGSDGRQPLETLKQAFQNANQIIYAQAQTDFGQAGMGTTCVCAWIIGDQVYASWLGDSRLYLLRGNSIQRLSIDHTFVQEALERGLLTDEQARNYPATHVIHRYLGSENLVEPDYRLRLRPGESDAQAEANQGFLMQGGDRILLCSDGLTDMVSEEEILSISLQHGLEPALEEMVALANQRGGLDNITLIGLEKPQAPEANLPAVTPARRRLRVASCLVAIALLGLALVALWVGSWYGDRTRPTAAPPPAGADTPVIQATATSSVTLPASLPTAMSTDLSVQPAVPSATLTAAQQEPVVTLQAATLTPWPTHTRAP